MNKFLAALACVGLAASYLALGVTPGHADANVIAAQAEAERTNPNNPGIGPKFNAMKAKCEALATQCQKDMKAPEPK